MEEAVLGQLGFYFYWEGSGCLLGKRFDVDEMEEVIFSLEGDKASGPDGFSILFFFFFFQRFWMICKHDVVAFIREFYARGRLSKNLCASFITLIPKFEGAAQLREFCPIRLIGSIYNILVSRLQKVLPSIISSSQGAFIKGKQILDDVLVANECIHSRYRNRSPSILCKLDLEKVYDRVDWGFLLYVLSWMGFGSKWRSWIRECVSSASFSVLVNGSLKGFFKGPKGHPTRESFVSFLVCHHWVGVE